jgi:hypothetical protein
MRSDANERRHKIRQAHHKSETGGGIMKAGSPVIDNLKKSRERLTVENFIALSYAFQGYTTIQELEDAELVEDVAEICGLVANGELIDEKHECRGEEEA